MLQKIQQYLSLVKFSHTIFAMPFAMIGFSMGIHFYPQSLNSFNEIVLRLLPVIFCMIFARNTAMAFNRYIDRHYDKLNIRTANREIPAGIIPSKHALLFTLINALFFMLSVFFINSLCFYLSPVALFVILFYSYTKRFTPLCHFVLGVGLALAPIGAYLAVSGRFDILPLCVSAMVFTWVSGFDILYALQDEEFDRANGLYSIPVLLGRKNALLLSRSLHIVCALFAIYILYSLFAIYTLIASVIFIALLWYQHYLVKVDDISKINLAFGTTNGIASVLYAIGIILGIFVK